MFFQLSAAESPFTFRCFTNPFWFVLNVRALLYIGVLSNVCHTFFTVRQKWQPLTFAPEACSEELLALLQDKFQNFRRPLESDFAKSISPLFVRYSSIFLVSEKLGSLYLAWPNFVASLEQLGNFMTLSVPHLKLSQKGVLLVAIPLCLLCVFYFGVKLRLNAVRQQMAEAEKRMSIVSSVNNLEVKSFFAFQSLLQLKMHGKEQERASLKQFMENLDRDATSLVDILRNQEHDTVNAVRIEKTFRSFMIAFRKSDFNPNPENEVGSILRNIDENQRFLATASVFFESLSAVAKVEQAAELESRSRLQSSQKSLETWVDVVVLSTLAVTLFTSVQFFRGTVKNLSKLKENALRFVGNKELLEAIGSPDEIGEVDRVFHEMVVTIRAAQTRDSYMMKLLQESKERLDVLLNNLPIAVIVTDVRGKIESINPAAAALFEYTPLELKNKPLEMLFPAGTRTAGTASIASAEATSSTSAPPTALIDQLPELTMTPLEALGKNQDAIFTEVQKKSFSGGDGDRVLVAALDVSERHVLEKLTKDFYAMVSHDIRSPLNAIDGTLEIALSKKYGTVSQELAERLSGARRNIAQLMALVNKLLELEKLEGPVKLALEDVDLRDVVDNVLELFTRQLETKKLTVDKELKQLLVRGDKQYIVQVVSNLLGNAIKYSPESGHILIKLEAIESQAELIVRDQGPGVPKDMREAIFERFKQIPFAGNTEQGFGLGLAICKQIVEKHGGSIGVRNVVSAEEPSGRGSEFWVRFNMHDSKLQTTAKESNIG